MKPETWNLKLHQGDDPLLLPITPDSSVDEIARLVREAGTSRVELLVPDKTDALLSADGARALRDAAVASGVRLTIYTADDRIAEAARQVNLDVFGVGATVAAPGQRPHRVDPPIAAEAEPPVPLPPLIAPAVAIELMQAAQQEAHEPPIDPHAQAEPPAPAEGPAAVPDRPEPFLMVPAAVSDRTEVTMPGAAADDFGLSFAARCFRSSGGRC